MQARPAEERLQRLQSAAVTLAAAIALGAGAALWVLWVALIMSTERGRAFLVAWITPEAERELRETRPELLTVATLVVAVLAIASIDDTTQTFLVLSFALLVTAWLIGWSIGRRWARLVSDALTWTGVIALLGAVGQMAPAGVAQAAMIATLAIAVAGSGWQGRAHYRSSQDVVDTGH